MDHETDYQISGREPMMWLHCARRLRRAADIIFHEVEPLVSRPHDRRISDDDVFLLFPYLMLCGMALENTLKGILVARDPAAVEAGTLNLNRWKGGEDSHDLLHLATLAGIDLTEVERDALVRMSEAVRWNGRYPIPMRSLQLEKTALLRGGSRSRRSFTTSDPALFSSLYEKTSSTLVAEAEKAHARMFERDASRVHEE